MTLTEKKCQISYIKVLVYPTGPKFSSVSLYLLPFSRYEPLPVSKVIWPWPPKKCQNPYIQVQVYPTGRKFSSVSLYLLPFRNTVHFLFWRPSDLDPEKVSKLIYTNASIPYGSQIFVHFALSLTVFEIRTTSCFEDQVTLTAKKCQISYIQVLVYPTGPKFSSVSLYLLPFSRYGPLPVSKFTWPWPRKSVKTHIFKY